MNEAIRLRIEGLEMEKKVIEEKIAALKTAAAIINGDGTSGNGGSIFYPKSEDRPAIDRVILKVMLENKGTRMSNEEIWKLVRASVGPRYKQSSISAQLSKLASKGVIQRPERGIYAVV